MCQFIAEHQAPLPQRTHSEAGIGGGTVVVVRHGTQAQTQLDLNPAIGVRLPASLPVVYLRFVGPICAHVPLSLSSLWVQWSPHPGPGFPTFAGIFEFAIRYFALERCFPFLAGTLFILLSLEVPRYHRHAFGSSTNGDNPVPAFQESPACPPPTRSVPAPTIASLGFLLSHHANIERIPPI